MDWCILGISGERSNGTLGVLGSSLGHVT
jgi:hypothetical protein